MAASLDIDKADVKRHEELVNHKVYDMLLRAEATAQANGRRIIEWRDIPITKGLQEGIEDFREMDEEVALRPLLAFLTRMPPLDLACSDEAKAELPNLAGGLTVVLARTIRIVDPDVKKPQTRHWDRASRLFDLLL